MTPKAQLGDKDYQYGFRDDVQSVYESGEGLSRQLLNEMSEMKKEPSWMRDFRLKALDIYEKKPMPTWGNTDLLHRLNLEKIHYYVRPADKAGRKWDEVPEKIKNTFERLGIPEAERKFLAGVTAQYESEIIYHSIREDLEKQGVIFLGMDEAVQKVPDLVRDHIGNLIPMTDNKFAALNSAVWSGGSFIYIPKNTHVEIPLQAYFRINAENMGQFERTLIITDEGSDVHYIEGCTAPSYSSDSLHAAVVELIALPGSKIRYTTIQNWSHNVYNLVTKRAVAHQDAAVEWVDGNIGSKLTMKYPAVYLKGKGARGEVLSIAYAGRGQHQDTGAKMFHAAPYTTSTILSKSISRDGGRASYRGHLKVLKGADHCRANVRCDALILDELSRSDTYPTMDINEKNASIGHEATVSRVEEKQLYYLMSRGLRENDARSLIINGFLEPFTKELPMEYAVELNRLIQLEMEGAVG